MGSLNTKRMVLALLAVFGLLAAVVCIAVLASGMREPTRERLFLVGSIIIVSLVCLFLAIRFKDDANELEAQMREAAYVRQAQDSRDPDEVALPQNLVGASDPDDVILPQNAPGARG